MKKHQPLEKTATKTGKGLFARVPQLIFGAKGQLPATSGKETKGKRPAKRFWVTGSLLVLAGIIGFGLGRGLLFNSGGTIPLSEAGFMASDGDYLAAGKEELCLLPSVRYEDMDRLRDSLGIDPGAGGDSTAVIPFNERGKRPRIDLDGLVYFEKLTKNRVRVARNDGTCAIYSFKDLMYNIQEQRACGDFQGVPREGVVTEYVNLHYVESFEKVRCGSKELFLARISIERADCATVRSIRDLGVGLFSLYVYRKLRNLLEDRNPHVDFRYRRTVERGEC